MQPAVQSITDPSGRLINPFVATRNCVIGLSYLRDVLGRDRERLKKHSLTKYSNTKLAEDIQKITGMTKINGKYISYLVQGHTIVTQDEYEALREAVIKISNNYEIPSIDINDIPFGVLTRFEGILRDIYGDDAVYRPRSAPELGDNLSGALQGMWRLFYIPPSTADGAQNIISNVAFFHNAGSKGNTAVGLLFGAHDRRWIATATRTVEEYVQITWSQFGGSEISSCIAAIDRFGFGLPKMIGVVSLLEQRESLPVPYRPRMLVGTICFGTQCTLDTCYFGDLSADELETPKPEEYELLKNAVAKASVGRTIGNEDEMLMRKFFRDTEVPPHRFHELFDPHKLGSYLQIVRDQGRLSLNSEAFDVLVAGGRQKGCASPALHG
jgi:hypothetical protein